MGWGKLYYFEFSPFKRNMIMCFFCELLTLITHSDKHLLIEFHNLAPWLWEQTDEAPDMFLQQTLVYFGGCASPLSTQMEPRRTFGPFHTGAQPRPTSCKHSVYSRPTRSSNLVRVCFRQPWKDSAVVRRVAHNKPLSKPDLHRHYLSPRSDSTAVP